MGRSGDGKGEPLRSDNVLFVRLLGSDLGYASVAAVYLKSDIRISFAVPPNCGLTLQHISLAGNIR